MYGIDIEKVRMDDLDKEVIKFAISLKNKKKKAIDLGCGSSRIGIVLGLLGWEVLAYDKQDYKSYFENISNLFNINIKFYKKDITKIKLDNAANAQIVIINRVLHYFSYNVSLNILEKLYNTLPAGSRIFASVTGIHSPAGKNYPCKHIEIEKRYCYLSPKQADKFKIYTKVCLYNKKELQTLIQKSGFKVVKIWRSRFKNIKVVAEKPTN